MSKASKDSLKLRLLTALPLIPLLLAVILMPALKTVFVLMVLFLSAMAAWEFKALISALRPEMTGLGLMLLAPVLPLVLFWEQQAGPLFFVSFNLLFFALVLEHLFVKEPPLERLAFSLAGLLYTGGLPCFFIALHRIPQTGPGLITLLLVAIGLSDTCAYGFGKAFGKHKLCPTVSPNKTIEGSIAGLCGGLAAGIIAYALQQHWACLWLPRWPWFIYVLIGLSLAITGQIGDLAESVLKRSAGVKDSGKLFPGHGGVLDRCDAFLFGGPTLYCALLLLEMQGFQAF
ncbi:MAG: phosphatidate cytidylyltransferase [Candidatus Hydrogenedens sp.]|nr:phosphatidate cytidylyltransferase [Candidatus Hydrogenedens sp.]